MWASESCIYRIGKKIARIFAGIQSNNYEDAREQILQIITNLYSQNEFLMESDKLGEKDKRFFDRVDRDMTNSEEAMALHQLTASLYQYYGKKVIILLDEYDTPL